MFILHQENKKTPILCSIQLLNCGCSDCRPHYPWAVGPLTDIIYGGSCKGPKLDYLWRKGDESSKKIVFKGAKHSLGPDVGDLRNLKFWLKEKEETFFLHAAVQKQFK